MRVNSSIALELAKLTEGEYPLFSSYCQNLNRGLRKAALEYLNQFLDTTLDWDYLKRSDFCNTLCNGSKSAGDVDFLLTTNLVEKLVRPTLLEMTVKLSHNYLAFKWYWRIF